MFGFIAGLCKTDSFQVCLKGSRRVATGQLLAWCLLLCFFAFLLSVWSLSFHIANHRYWFTRLTSTFIMKAWQDFDRDCHSTRASPR